MKLCERPLENYFQVARWWVLAIVLVGAARLILSTAGLPNSQVKFVSMTVVIALGTAYFPVWCARKGWSYRDLFVLSYFLTVPYMAVEVVGLSLVVLNEQPNIFHAGEYSFGTTPQLHLMGHLVGGVTWEPWTLWLVSSSVLWITSRVERRVSRLAG
ncbi:MAG: hypothetical protein HYX74_05410 [Acidobacteria bacterium]|nr:hypothetical protein [Acidobacteriota bacterium]